MNNTSPGIYTSITDNSAVSPTTSLFKVGFVGPASKGPLNTPTLVGSIRTLEATYGGGVSGDYTMLAAACVSAESDGVYFSRIAKTYEDVGSGVDIVKGPFSWTRSGTTLTITGITPGIPIGETGLVWARVYIAGSKLGDFSVIVGAETTSLHVPAAVTTAESGTSNLTLYYLYELTDLDVAALASAGQYIKLYQPGMASTTNLKVVSSDKTTGRVKFVRAPGYTDPSDAETIETVSNTVSTSAVDIASPYSMATVSVSSTANAANQAEAFLTAPVWGATVDTFTVSGDINSYELQATLAVGGTGTIYAAMVAAGLMAGTSVIRIVETGKTETIEALIRSFDYTGKIQLQPSYRGDIGYHPVSLSSTYSAASVQLRTGQAACAHIIAASSGTWANTTASSGLVVEVVPGTRAGTKRIRAYTDGILVDDLDGLVADDTSTRYWTSYINANATSIQAANEILSLPSNTSSPWIASRDKVNSPNFTLGDNGANVDADDFVGIESGETVTGIKAYQYASLIPDIKFLACPGVTNLIVARELARVAEILNCEAAFDVPDNYRIYDAVAWHNGAVDDGTDSYSKLDDWKVSLFWNWAPIDDPISGDTIWAPPSAHVLVQIAKNYRTSKPWYAHAGETRGVLSTAKTLRYTRITRNMLDACYGDGNCINPIIPLNGKFVIWGNRTTQRTETKLSALNCALLVNEVMQRLSKVASRYEFEPNDATLLDNLRQDCDAVLTGIQNERGIESYTLTIDSSNNTAATRNARSAYIDFSLVPTGAVERLYLRASVSASTATLVSAQ